MHTDHTISVPADKPHYRRALILVHLIDTALKKVKIQKNRIVTEKEDHTKIVELFADIHFLLITLSNIRKLLPELGKLFNDSHEYSKLCDKYLPALDKVGIIRNHLEHILDGRLEGKGYRGQPLSEPNTFGNLAGDEYNFGGDTFNLSDMFTMCLELENELKAWNKKVLVYPLWSKS